MITACLKKKLFVCTSRLPNETRATKASKGSAGTATQITLASALPNALGHPARCNCETEAAQQH